MLPTLAMSPYRFFWVRLGAWMLLMLGVLSAAWAQELQPIPPLTASVVDLTGTLKAPELDALREKLSAAEKANGAQVAILMVATTQPEDIVSYANRVANAWKIGRKAVGDGVLVVVAKQDRKVRIEVAKALEGALPDLASKQIIDETLTPHFRQGNYAQGLQDAVGAIVARVNGEALPAPTQARNQTKAPGGIDWYSASVLLFFAVPLVAAVLRRSLGRKLGALATGGGVGAVAGLLTSSALVGGLAAVAAGAVAIFSAGMTGDRRNGGWGALPWLVLAGGSHGGGGGGGGGGYSSGGGGDFGGGGASGDW